jgi:hypothetical protein
LSSEVRRGVRERERGLERFSCSKKDSEFARSCGFLAHAAWPGCLEVVVMQEKLPECWESKEAFDSSGVFLSDINAAITMVVTGTT